MSVEVFYTWQMVNISDLKPHDLVLRINDSIPKIVESVDLKRGKMNYTDGGWYQGEHRWRCLRPVTGLVVRVL